MVNKVLLIGNLTQDPELRYIPSSGTAVVKFALAVNRPFTNQQGERETDFINITAWRKLAENCANYIQKGSKVYVEGRLQIRSFDDKDGIRRKVAEVVADNVQFLDKKGSGNSGVSDSAEEENVKEEEYPPENIKDDDIPF